MDATLIDACKRTVFAFKTIDGGMPGNEGEMLYNETVPLLELAIDTPATTIAGCIAKAKLCLASQNDDLLESLVRDVAALGE